MFDDFMNNERWVFIEYAYDIYKYRKHESGLLGFKDSTLINADINQVLLLLRDTRSYPRWMTGVIKTHFRRICERCYVHIMTKVRTGYRDMIVEINWGVDSNSQIINFCSVPLKLFDAVKGAARVLAQGSWILTPSNPGTRVELRMCLVESEWSEENVSGQSLTYYLPSNIMRRMREKLGHKQEFYDVQNQGAEKYTQ